jgi:hypothetical protein
MSAPSSIVFTAMRSAGLQFLRIRVVEYRNNHDRSFDDVAMSFKTFSRFITVFSQFLFLRMDFPAWVRGRSTRVRTIHPSLMLLRRSAQPPSRLIKDYSGRS